MNTIKVDIVISSLVAQAEVNGYSGTAWHPIAPGIKVCGIACGNPDGKGVSIEVRAGAAVVRRVNVGLSFNQEIPWDLAAIRTHEDAALAEIFDSLPPDVAQVFAGQLVTVQALRQSQRDELACAIIRGLTTPPELQSQHTQLSRIRDGLIALLEP